MDDVEFDSNIWGDIARAIDEFYDKRGIVKEIIEKSPDKIIIDFSLIAQYLDTKYTQLLLDRIESVSVYQDFTTLLMNQAKEKHANPNKLKLVAIKNMKMRLGLTKVSDFVSSSFNKMVCMRVVVRSIT